MSGQKYDIVMFNMSAMADWDSGIVNRNYFILHELAKREEVRQIVAVDFLPLTFKKAVKTYWNMLRQMKNNDIVYGDLTSMCYKKTAKISVYTTIDSLFSWKTVMKKLRKICDRLDVHQPVAWSYNALFVEGIPFLNPAAWVFDTVDNWSEHVHFTALVPKEQIIKNYELVADKADIIFTVADELRAFYASMNRSENVQWVPNGVALDVLNDPALINRINVLSAITQPIIGYLGTIQDRLDFELIGYVAKQNPDAVVALCGPVWDTAIKEVELLKNTYANVMTTGRIAYEDAPGVIHRFSVAIIPHKMNAFITSTNPMKMYEYLAAGKPIVTTEGAGVDQFKEVLTITNEKEAFNQAVQRELHQDSPEKQRARQVAVAGHTWAARVDRMLEVLIKHLGKTGTGY